MEELLKLAITNGNTTATCGLCVLMLIKWAGPPVWRKLILGKNGSSTMQGQLDKIEAVVQKTHDIVIRNDERMGQAEKRIESIFKQCAENHMQAVAPAGKDGGK